MKHFLIRPILLALALLMSNVAFANLPLPLSKPDCSLLGVNRVVVFSDQAFDSTVLRRASNNDVSSSGSSESHVSGPMPIGEPNEIADIDILELNRIAVDQLRSMTAEKADQLFDIRFFPNEVDAYEAADGNTLIINFTFGTRAANLGSDKIVLGAVYPTARRGEPRPGQGQVIAEPTSGFNGLPPAIPFLLNNNSPDENQDVASLALARAVASVAQLIAQIPMDGTCEELP